ncbi:MAG: glycosyltransferase family 4 protein [Candidatus Brocadiia bacterium]
MVERRPKLVYILAQFPSPTETFIANEISGVIENGAALAVFAFRQGEIGEMPPCRVFYRGQKEYVRMSGFWKDYWAYTIDACRLEWRAAVNFLYTLRNLGTARELAQIVQEENITHLHAHFAHIPADLALMVGKREDLTVSFSAHAWDVYCQEKTVATKIRRSNLCITCTEAARRHLESLVEDDQKSKIQTIYHGTDLERFEQTRNGELGAPPRLLAVGRLVPKKGFDVLLYACQRLAARRDFHLKIVGEGPFGPRLKKLTSDFGLSERVTFAGHVPYEKMPEVYRNADLIAVPSVIGRDGNRDGLPNVVVEAMASGVPVVGSRLSGIPEAIYDRETGILTVPGDSASLADGVSTLLSDDSLRENCVKAARNLVEEKFDYRQNAAHVHEALQGAGAP